MASNAPSAPTGEGNPNLITHEDTIQVTINRQTASIYPKVESSWPIAKRASAFHTTKAGLQTIKMAPDQFLDMMGIYMGLSTVVDGYKFDFMNHFDDNWLNMAVLTIMSFHNSAGTILNTASTAADPNILKPVADGPVAQCRPADVRFVRLQINLDFVDLVTAVGQDHTVLRTEYYLELPQTSVNVNDANGNARNLVTFHGQADLRTLSVQQLKDDILAHVPQDGPVNLIEAAFNVTAATTDDILIAEKIRNAVLRLAEPTILHELFKQLCPNYTNKPQAAVEGITQSFTDASGNPICSTVAQYFHRFQAAARPFANQRVFPCDLVAMFIAGMHPDVKSSFEEQYPRHNEPHDRTGRLQRVALAEVLRLATIAESRVATVQSVVARQVGQTFLTDVAVPGYASQAETTLKQHQGGGVPSADGSRVQGLGPGQSCFGCGDTRHPWMRNGVVICPKKDQPGVVQKAAENRKKLVSSRKARGKQGRLMAGTPKLSDLSPKGKRAIRKEVLAAAASSAKDDSDSRDDKSPDKKKTRTPFTFFTVVVYQTKAATSKKPLPVAINTNLPHIPVTLGTGEIEIDWPTVSMIIDSAAALNTMNLGLAMRLGQRFPGCVKAIHAPQDHVPITLSGIVQNDGKAVTTELPIAFEFFLPYLLADGTPTTITFACGPHVSVNAILGYPFCIAAKLVVDFADNVAEFRALACRPFQIEAKRARLHVPSVDAAAVRGHGSSVNEDLVKELLHLDAYLASVYALTSIGGAKRTRLDGDNDPLAASAAAVEAGGSLPLGAPAPRPDLGIPPSFGRDGSGGLLPGEFMAHSLDLAAGEGLEADDDTSQATLPTSNRSPLRTLASPAVPNNDREPIRPAPKPAKGRKRPNVFFDDRGYPDVSHEFDTLLHNIDGHTVLRKRKHAAPRLDDIDPLYYSPFVEEKHGSLLKEQLNTEHLTPIQANKLTALIKKYWSVFDSRGLFVPVKDYECVIDTGSAPPIAVKKIHYGPREIPIMRKCIAALEKLGHISQIHDGRWLFKALLAPKPHQEHVVDIADFVWRFCVNYIPLNSVTRVLVYPIPRCDSAVFIQFGDAQWFWTMDATQGYHQLRVAKESREKLAFQGTDAIKWTYNVMPFGPVNGPSIFIMFAHDVDSTWKQLATEEGLTIDDDTNSNLIVDDILSWAMSFEHGLKFLECQLRVCQSQNLSLSLKKSHFFPQRLEFVGVDVCTDGNRPAMSKNQLISTWRTPTIVRDVASFIGFALFYGTFIACFELRVKRLREICKLDMSEDVKPHWDPDAQAEFEDIKNALLSDPCLRRFDHRKRLYLRTDFSALGFGYAALQPGDDEESLAAMHREIAGGECEFMQPNSTLLLHCVSLGSRRCRGYEERLHSHLGEAFALDWAINRNRHMIFGMRFTAITDCYALRFILSYDGGNPAILRLQMRLMCVDMDLLHRVNQFLVDADYWSRLGQDLRFDPLLSDYIQRVVAFRAKYCPPETTEIMPQNMPGYRGPRLPKLPRETRDPSASSAPEVDAHAASILACIISNDCNGHSEALQNVPVLFGQFDSSVSMKSIHSGKPLYNNDMVLAAKSIVSFDWAVYAFNSGHFASSARTRGLPFRVVLAADMFAEGRALFQEFTECKLILSGVREMYDHVRSCGDRSALHGYLIHSHRFQQPGATRNFWQLQASLIVELRKQRSLSLFVAFIHQDHDGRPVSQFISTLRAEGWVIDVSDVYFPDFGDSVAASTRLAIGVHTLTESIVSAVRVPKPPESTPPSIGSYIWAPFDKQEMAVSLARDEPAFSKAITSDAKEDADNPSELRMIAQTPKPADTSAARCRSQVEYYLHRSNMDDSITAGSEVMSLNHLCPPFSGVTNNNIFGSFFGIEFRYSDGIESHMYVRPFSPFEFVRCFNLFDDLTYRISDSKFKFYLDAAIPGLTSAHVLEACNDRLIAIRNANIQVYDPDYAAPAATCQAFVNGAIGARLPSTSTWTKAYSDDAETALIRDMVQNPSLVKKENLNRVNHNFRMPLRHSLIAIENEMLIYREPLDGGSSYCKLRIVPASLREIIFIAFHANPIGGHFNPYRTYSRMRLRYYFPGMYKYCERKCASCPGCALANRHPRRSKELVYGFPIAAPFMVLHVDGYSAGAHMSFEGDVTYCIACDGMTGFGVMEPVQSHDSTGFASALMRIMMRFGLCHTLVLDKASNFYGIFQQVVELLKLNVHTLSGDNHDGMLVERLNRYLNKGLKIMTNERDSVRVACEAILMLIYAWNSAPIPGTDLPRSLVAVGRVFSFPIDFSAAKHLELTSKPARVQSFARDQATLLKASREVAKVLLEEHRALHRELWNSTRETPRHYEVGDVVFARRATQSSKKKERVGKLMYAYTGPWRIVEKLSGGSYRLEHASTPGRFDKKHAAHLSPYPEQLVPLEPVDGPDNRYGQLFRPIAKDPYIAAGLKGFEPATPFKVPANFAMHSDPSEFYWPSLAELNEEMSPFPWEPGEEERVLREAAEYEAVPIMYHGPPPAAPIVEQPPKPSVATLVSDTVRSQDKLFFISHSLGLNSRREWRLVRVALAASMASHPACLQDGRFLVEFYVPHCADVRYNAINQRFWLQYHSVAASTSPVDTTAAHLIRPSDTSESYAASKGFAPFRQWVNLTHESTYIHGPFDFSVWRGRKSRDRIDAADWDVLRRRSACYDNAPPKLELPTYSIHVDRRTHSIVPIPEASRLSVASGAYPW